MAQLVIDIGNWRTKFAVFHKRRLTESGEIEKLDSIQLNHLIDVHNITHSIISSVSVERSNLEEILKKRTKYIRFSAGVKAGVINKYKSPQTLGLDRLAGVIGAKALFPETNCLVIDAGTCITYDAVDTTGVYEGGSISPGLNMRLQAMHHFTGRLPEVELSDYAGWQGYDTPSAMLSGVLNGCTEEVRGMIEIYRSRYLGLQVILCGGDAIFFDTRLKNSIFAHTLKTEPNLVLIGLNEVIEQQ